MKDKFTVGAGWCFGGPWVTPEIAASSGMKVKRAGPGGEGAMIDPFSPAAMSNHIARFEAAFGKGGTARRPLEVLYGHQHGRLRLPSA